MEPRTVQDAISAVMHTLSFLPTPAVDAIIIALAILASLAVHQLLRGLLRRSLKQRPFMLSLVERVRALTRLAFATIALELVVPALRLSPNVSDWIATGLRFVFVVLVGWIALIAVDVGTTIYLARFRVDTADNLLARKHVTQMRVLKRVIETLVVVFTAGAALMTISAVREVGVSLFASAGVAGLVAGLAARPVLSNLIAGVQLAMTQPIRIDDAVIVENEWGRIEEITSTYVVVRIWDLRRLIVPLSYFIEKPFQNWTRESTALLGSVLLYLDYAAPIDRIRAKAAEIAQNSKLWDRRVVNVQVSDAKERTIEVRVLVSAADSSTAWDLRCEMREKLIAFLRAEFPESLPRARADVVLNDTSAADANRPEAQTPRPAPPRASGARMKSTLP
jgi:small-conductance mechanosensitive channel